MFRTSDRMSRSGPPPASCTKNGQGEANSEISANSLLSVLDDKNNAIASLQKQLQNQKEQLSYYLKKELRAPKIMQLSESCSPRAPQESMPVNMAMNKYGKQLGIKTNICTLYERMCIIDDRISASLEDQEFILRKVVNKLCEFVKYANGKIEFKVQFSNFITDPFHIELFNKLLIATVHLRKKLDTFRICCNRLMVVEDERNTIVEQIYSMPADQRMNCNYIISIQTEKIQLEKELKQILKEQGEDRERIRELNIIEEKLSNLQRQLNSAFMRTDETCRINKMLQKVNQEAKMLLELTKEQRKKYEKEVIQARSQKNLSLEKILLYIRLATEGLPTDKKRLSEMGVTSKEDIAVFECVKKEIEKGKDKLIGRIFDDLQAKRKDCETFTNKLNEAMLEKNELKIANVQLQRDISEMKLHQCKDLSRLKYERDAFRSQVEDLEAIREAYAQLVDRQPSTSRIEKEYLEQIADMDRQINELEKLNMNLTQKMNVVKVVVNKQHREIKSQNEIIEDLREQVEKSYEIRNENSYEIRNEKKPKYAYKQCGTDDSGINNSSPRDTILTEDFVDEISFGEVYQEEIFVEQEINWIEEHYHSPLRAKQVSFAPPNKCDHSGDRYKKQTKKIVETIKNHISKSNDDKSMRWMSKKEKNATNGLDDELDPREDLVNDKDMDEEELMGDCSREIIPVCVSRIRSTKMSLNRTSSQEDNNNAKKVEVLANFKDKIGSDSSDEYMKHCNFTNIDSKQMIE